MAISNLVFNQVIQSCAKFYFKKFSELIWDVSWKMFREKWDHLKFQKWKKKQLKESVTCCEVKSSD